MSLLSDAIGHVLLLGIVLAYFLTGDLRSFWLFLGAASTGLLLVFLVESLQKSKKIKEDAAIGLVFPALFSLGILLATMYLRNTHLDVDQILLGIPELAIRRRLIRGGYDWGSIAILSMILITILNLILILTCFKEWKLSTFDPILAAQFGLMPGLLNHILMASVSITAVGAFDAVGPVLVVAFMVVPAATAYLLTNRLAMMLLTSLAFAVTGAILGTLLAIQIDCNIAGTVATTLGIQFAIVLIAAPERGLIVRYQNHLQQKKLVLSWMVLFHLLQHEKTDREAIENRLSTLHEHMQWGLGKLNQTVQALEKKGWVIRQGALLEITPLGVTEAQRILPFQMALKK